MRDDGKHIYYNVETDYHDMAMWINKNSLKIIEQLSPEVYKIFDAIKAPVLIAFINTESREETTKAGSKVLLNILERLNVLYKDKITFAKHETEGNQANRYNTKAQGLGLPHAHL